MATAKPADESAAPSATASKNIQNLTFGVSLPSSIADDSFHSLPSPAGGMGDAGMVGSILLLPNAAMVWMGWGHTRASSDGNSIKGTGFPTMGQTVVSFPKLHKQGAFSNQGPSCSQLVGGSSTEDDVLANQMACRLSHKVGKPIFVSLALHASEPQEWMAGLDRSTTTQRAAALAEKRARQLLQQHFGSGSS